MGLVGQVGHGISCLIGKPCLTASSLEDTVSQPLFLGKLTKQTTNKHLGVFVGVSKQEGFFSSCVSGILE